MKKQQAFVTAALIAIVALIALAFIQTPEQTLIETSPPENQTVVNIYDSEVEIVSDQDIDAAPQYVPVVDPVYTVENTHSCQGDRFCASSCAGPIAAGSCPAGLQCCFA